MVLIKPEFKGHLSIMDRILKSVVCIIDGLYHIWSFCIACWEKYKLRCCFHDVVCHCQSLELYVYQKWKSCFFFNINSLEHRRKLRVDWIKSGESEWCFFHTMMQETQLNDDFSVEISLISSYTLIYSQNTCRLRW